MLAACLCAMSAQAEGIAERAQKAWSEVYPQVEARIKAPTFRDKDYNILDFDKSKKKKGKKAAAKSADFLYTDMINSAIKKCSADGGGRVVVPAGTYLTGPIHLLSNVNLHLEKALPCFSLPIFRNTIPWCSQDGKVWTATTTPP